MHVSELLCSDEQGSPCRVQLSSTSTTPSPAPTSTPPPTTPTQLVPSQITTSLKRRRWDALPRRPYKKFYANATPSSHCHVCARTAKAVRFAVCSRLQAGLCRKVICDKCFARFGWDWIAALNDADWVCPHCRDACPPGKSQCYIYARVNRRRETKRAAKAAAAAAEAAAAAAVAAASSKSIPLRRSITKGSRNATLSSSSYIRGVPMQQVSFVSPPQMNQYLSAPAQVTSPAMRSPPVAIDNLVGTSSTGPPPLGVLPVLPPPSTLLLPSSSWLQ